MAIIDRRRLQGEISSRCKKVSIQVFLILHICLLLFHIVILFKHWKRHDNSVTYIRILNNLKQKKTSPLNDQS